MTQEFIEITDPEQGGAVVGMLTFIMMERPETAARPYCRVLSLKVEDDWQRQRMGSYLMFKLAEEMLKRRVHLIELDDVSGTPFYEKLGFQSNESDGPEVWAASRVVMARAQTMVSGRVDERLS